MKQTFDEAKSLHERIQRTKDLQHVPMVLVGNKVDLASERQVSTEEGAAQAKTWGVPFFESSALTYTNVMETFHECVREILRARAPNKAAREAAKPKKKRRCVLL